MSGDSLVRRAVRKVRHLLRRPALSSRQVAWAYRLFLDREPENPSVVADKQRRISSVRDLRQEFMGSEEFRGKNPQFHAPALDGLEPPLPVARVESPAELAALFDHIQAAWRAMGETQPYWSVITSTEYMTGRIESTREKFYESGRKDLELILAAFARNGVDPAALRTCIEYGCGLGRVTRWLAERFKRVHGFDISESHLRIAKEQLDARGVRNVELHHVREVADIGRLPKADFVFSFIVLQHNPPPLIRFMIRSFLGALNPGGVALFQVPTYRQGYRFALQDYLRDEGTRGDMEMHVLPQEEIFGIAASEGCRPLEVLEDGQTGLRAKEMSNTFFVRKNG